MSEWDSIAEDELEVVVLLVCVEVGSDTDYEIFTFIEIGRSASVIAEPCIESVVFCTNGRPHKNRLIVVGVK